MRWLFIRLLGVVYLVAFISFGMQVPGLIGSRGIEPAHLYLARIAEVAGSSGYRMAPTLFWIGSGDAVLYSAWIAGAVCAVLAIAGVFWRGALAACFILYLSFVNVSQEFLSYQWDFLLLETGFLALFLGYGPVIDYLFRWLLFRLMFFSGAVKLLSGDLTWRGLTALTVHYQTQPLPSPVAWYAHNLPPWFQQASCVIVLFIELVVPFFVLGPRRARLFALPWLAGLQALIMLTGNFAFFNLLTLALCIFLVDDGVLARVSPVRWRNPAALQQRSFIPERGREAIAWSAAALVIGLSILIALHTLTAIRLPGSGPILEAAAPFGIVNSYGLFANMTTTRSEIIVEGSNDAVSWRPYEFKYKPGRLDRMPAWIAPLQPRLDWQMWFAALGSYRKNVWFVNFVARLLQGEPRVLRLLDNNPFRDHPPRFVRAVVYEYHFTDPRTRAQTGQWWTRTPAGGYLPAVSLDSLSELRILR